ncbi:MAG: hypothetical protein ABSG15_02285 [FCB group bacterium]|jgi:hypothetical protein
MKKVLTYLVIMLFGIIYMGSAQTWNGLWMYSNNVTLTITNETNKSFHFVFITDKVKGAEGNAIIKGTTAIYKASSSITFELAIDTSLIRVSYKNLQGRVVQLNYKMSTEDFFKRINKETAPVVETKGVLKSKPVSEAENIELQQFFGKFTKDLNLTKNNTDNSMFSLLRMFCKVFSVISPGDTTKLVTTQDDKLRVYFNGYFPMSIRKKLLNPVEFKSFIADISWADLGVSKGTTILTTEIDLPNEKVFHFKIFIIKDENNFKICAIEKNKQTDSNQEPASEPAPTVTKTQTSQTPKGEKSEFLKFFTEFQNATNPMPNKKILPTLINYPLEVKHEGELLKYNQKQFTKEIPKLFTANITGKFFINDFVKFDSFLADPSWNGLGVQTNSTIFTANVELQGQKWSYFKIYVSKINGEFKIITIETD